MKVGVLALQGDVAEHADALDAVGAHPVPVRVPAELDGVDAVVLPGGESTAISMLLASSGLFEPLAARLAAGLPALGTCAGMILLGDQVLDGRPDQTSFGVIDIAIRRNGFGRQAASFETALSVPALGDEFVDAVFIRAPVVVRTGPGVEVLASYDGSPVACRQANVLVTSFHPELSGDRRLHRYFVDTICERRS